MKIVKIVKKQFFNQSINIVSQTLFILNNKKNDNEFKNFDVNNSDENFNVSKNKNELTKND